MGVTSLRNRVLRWVRQHGDVSVREVHGALSDERTLSVNTIATVLNRLVDQGILIRTGSVRNYRYLVKPDPDVINAHTEESIHKLFAEFGDAGLVYFVDAIERIEPGSLSKLEQIVQHRKSTTLKDGQ